MASHQILFLTLRVFSATGGIEKVCRILSKALLEITTTTIPASLKVFSMYDSNKELNSKYIPENNFTGFGMHKLNFVFTSIRQGMKSKVVILSHINLLSVGILIKLFSPKTKLVLITHGIEVWKPFPFYKRWMLNKCDQILPVSAFTKETMKRLNHFDDSKFTILNNCLDPFLPPISTEAKDAALLKRYGLSNEDTILLTVTRLSAKERYKGYDQVIRSMKPLVQENAHLHYLIVGKFDDTEKQHLDELIIECKLEQHVVFAGFIPDAELAAHYNLADIYVMPSKKEGFGLVFIEAMFYGKRVIAGNKDGSVDALLNGQLGLLVDPDNEKEITMAISKMLQNKNLFQPDRDLLMQNFSYNTYKNNLTSVLTSLHP